MEYIRTILTDGFQLFAGICLFLRSDKSKLDSYNCRHFEYGCPTSYYTGSTAYICNILLEYIIYLMKQFQIETFPGNVRWILL